MSAWPAPLADAYAACEQLARSHYENFPVASRLLPAAMRPHVAAVYAFARVADDLADEGTLTPEARRANLAQWREGLHRAARDPAETRSSDRDELILTAIGNTIQLCDLPVALFDDLISAFGQDTMTTRYASWCDLVDYCRRSANPVGRLVLRIAGYRDEALDRSSDGLCTALQLTNFWQDFGRDWSAGRLYVPAEVMETCGAREDELDAATLGDAWNQAIEACVVVTRQYFRQGRTVCDGVEGWLRFELRLTWLGGVRVLERVAFSGAGVRRHRPRLGAADVPGLLWRALRWTADDRDLRAQRADG